MIAPLADKVPHVTSAVKDPDPPITAPETEAVPIVTSPANDPDPPITAPDTDAVPTTNIAPEAVPKETNAEDNVLEINTAADTVPVIKAFPQPDAADPRFIDPAAEGQIAVCQITRVFDI
jgi:hypothetical protein